MCILAHADKIADTQTHERMHLLTLKHLQRHTFSDHHTTSATIRIDITNIVHTLAHGLTHNTRASSGHHTTSATIRIDITDIVRTLAHTLTHNTRAFSDHHTTSATIRIDITDIKNLPWRDDEREVTRERVSKILFNMHECVFGVVISFCDLHE